MGAIVGVDAEDEPAGHHDANPPHGTIWKLELRSVMELSQNE